MTLAEARYVVENRHLYDNRTFMYALDIIDSARRQGIDR